MNNYYRNDLHNYFEEPKTVSMTAEESNAKAIVEEFKREIVDPRYDIKRPKLKILGHVKK